MLHQCPRPALAGLAGFVLLLLGSFSAAQPATYTQQSNSTHAPHSLVAGVRVVGNETTKMSLIQSQLKTRKDREFDPNVVQADVRRLASTGRFRDVRTYTQETPQGLVVTFEVFERPTIRYIRYLGNRNISDKALTKEDGLEVGDSLNRYAVEEAQR